MILYLTIIIASVFLVSCFNIIFPISTHSGYAIWIILVMILAVVVEIIIDGIVATVVHSLPDKWFKMDNKLYNVGNRRNKDGNNMKMEIMEGVKNEIKNLMKNFGKQ